MEQSITGLDEELPSFEGYSFERETEIVQRKGKLVDIKTNVLENLKIINSDFFNGYIISESYKGGDFKDEIERLYKLTCKLYNLPYEGEEEKGELSDDELGMIDRRFYLTNDTFDVKMLLKRPKLLKQIIVCRRNIKFYVQLNDYINDIIRIIGYDYIFYYKGRYRADFSKMINLLFLTITSKLKDINFFNELVNLRKLNINDIPLTDIHHSKI